MRRGLGSGRDARMVRWPLHPTPLTPRVLDFLCSASAIAMGGRVGVPCRTTPIGRCDSSRSPDVLLDRSTVCTGGCLDAGLYDPTACGCGEGWVKQVCDSGALSIRSGCRSIRICRRGYTIGVVGWASCPPRRCPRVGDRQVDCGSRVRSLCLPNGARNSGCQDRPPRRSAVSAIQA